DLAKHDLILFRSRDARSTVSLVGTEGPVTFEASPKITADDMSFLARAAASGAGIALIPAMLARGRADRAELELVLRGYRLDGGGLHVVLPSSAFVPSRVALVRDFLIERLGTLFKAVEQACSKHAIEEAAAKAATKDAPRRRPRLRPRAKG